MIRPEEDEGTGAALAGTESLANEGGDTGLTGAMVVKGEGWAGVNVGDSFDCFMASGQEAGGTSGIKDD